MKTESLENGLTAEMVEWLEEIDQQVTALFHKMHMFNSFEEVYTSNPKLKESDGTFFNETGRSYIESAVSLIYRLCDKRSATRSFVNFLKKLKNDHWHVLTRERHKALYSDGLERNAETTFDKLAGKDANRFSKDQLEELIQKLRKEEPIKTILDFRSDYVAHWSKDPIEKPKFRKLVQSVEQVGKILKKIRLLLKATSSDVDLTPTIQSNWTEPFEVP